MNAILYLGIEQVIAIHEKSIRNYGGQAGLRDRGLLEAAVHSPMWSVGLIDAHPDVFSKTAALLRSLVLNHCFVDGNKRTAFMSAFIFLKINGYELKASQEEAAQFMFKVASGAERDIQQIANWLMIHCAQATRGEGGPPIFDVQVQYEREKDFSKGTMKFWVKAGFLEKSREILFQAEAGKPASSFRFFKPRDHADHVEVVHQLEGGKIRRVDYRLGDIQRNKDNQVALQFDGDAIALSIDGKIMNPIELDES